MFENCTKCRHAIKRTNKTMPILDGMRRVKGDLYVKCAMGHTDKFADYFKRNLTVPYGGMEEAFECYTKSELEEKTEQLLIRLNSYSKEG